MNMLSNQTQHTAERDIVIVGAGILGAAVAWHLGQLGQGHRVVVLERQMPMAGATSRAAALVTLLRGDRAQIRMAQETLAAIRQFELKERGCVGHHPCGSLHVVPGGLASSLEPQIAACQELGVDVHWVDRDVAMQRAPWLTMAPDAAVLHVPDDSYVDPFQLGMAYLREAQRAGVQLRTGTAATGIGMHKGAACGVETAQHGWVRASTVVLAAGAWTNVLSAAVGVPLPMAAVRSQYWMTASRPDVPRDGPIVFLPEIKAYARPEVGGLLFGLREAHSVAVDARVLPADLAGFEFDADDSNGWESLNAGSDALARYWPGLHDAEIAHYVSGPSNYTLDGKLLVGPSQAVPGLWIASGCNGSGITFSAGIGRLLAEKILGRTPTFVDGHSMDIQRHGVFDPFDGAFIAACAAARSGKTTG